MMHHSLLFKKKSELLQKATAMAFQKVKILGIGREEMKESIINS